MVVVFFSIDHNLLELIVAGQRTNIFLLKKMYKQICYIHMRVKFVYLKLRWCKFIDFIAVIAIINFVCIPIELGSVKELLIRFRPTHCKCGLHIVSFTHSLKHPTSISVNIEMKIHNLNRLVVGVINFCVYWIDKYYTTNLRQLITKLGQLT